MWVSCLQLVLMLRFVDASLLRPAGTGAGTADAACGRGGGEGGETEEEKVLAWEVLANLCHAPSVRELAFGHGLVDALHSRLSDSLQEEVGKREEAAGGAELGSEGRRREDALVSLFRCVLVLAVPDDSRRRYVA